MFDNKGTYITAKDDFAGDYINNLTLNYTIKPKEIGLVYGTIFVKTNDQDEKAHFKSDSFNNYARFIADLISDKVIYSEQLDSFLIVKQSI